MIQDQINYHGLMDKSALLYERRINDRLVASVRQLRTYKDTNLVDRDWRSQFLVLALLDERTGRWMMLRLSSVRKILAWLLHLQFAPIARRLTSIEKKILDRRWDASHPPVPMKGP